MGPSVAPEGHGLREPVSRATCMCDRSGLDNAVILPSIAQSRLERNDQ